MQQDFFIKSESMLSTNEIHVPSSTNQLHATFMNSKLLRDLEEP